MRKSDERTLRDLSLMAQDARDSGRSMEEDVAHSAMNEILEREEENSEP